MGIDLNQLREAMKGSTGLSNNWCDNITCVYSQKGFCITGPELKFVNDTQVQGQKQKPVLICHSFTRR
jgi:hypothetical protein